MQSNIAHSAMPGCRKAIAIACATLASAASWAQVSSTVPNAGTIMQTVPQEQKSEHGDVQLKQQLPVHRPALKGLEGLNLEIKRFKISGLTIVNPAEVVASLNEFLGAGKTFLDIQYAMDKVRSVLASKGYLLTDVYVPPQKIKDGEVEIAVVEGRIGTVTLTCVDGKDAKEVPCESIGIRRSFIESFLRKLEPGTIMTTAMVETPLLLLGDLKGIEARSSLQPGKTEGTSDLLVRINKTATVSGSVDLDANGSLYLGVLRGGAAWI